jgi:DNA modification methylase
VTGPISASRSARLKAFFDRLEECVDKNTVTHGLHPYPAKFIPHIPRELIAAYSRPGETIWDPMCGSGTSLVEAALAGRSAIGSDINPIAILASKAKTTPLPSRSRDEIRGLLLRIRVNATVWPGGRPDRDPYIPDFHNRDHWFTPRAQHELGLLLEDIEALETDAARQLALCAFSAIIVAVSNQEGETRWRARRLELEPGAVLARFAAKLRASLAAAESYARRARAEVEVARWDARDRGLLDRKVDLIVTSPPYANTHDYYLYNKLRMFWLGEDVKAVQAAEIGSRNLHSDRGAEIGHYLDAMKKAMIEMKRALRHGGRMILVIGDGVIRGTLYSMDELIPPIAASLGMPLEEHFAFDHRLYNTALHNGFETTRTGKLTHVLIFRQE